VRGCRWVRRILPLAAVAGAVVAGVLAYDIVTTDSNEPVPFQEPPTLSDAEEASAIQTALVAPSVQAALAGRPYKVVAAEWSQNDFSTGRLTRSGAAVTFYVRADEGQYYGEFVVTVDLPGGEVAVWPLGGRKPMPPVTPDAEGP